MKKLIPILFALLLSLPFNRLFAADDVLAPVITSGPVVTYISDATAVIEWHTDEESNGSVRYGQISNSWSDYAFEKVIDNLATHHVLVITNLSPSTLYYFRVGSTDIYGNGPDTTLNDNNPSLEYNFITGNTPDVSAPVITIPPAVTALSDTTAIIEWSTNELAMSTVEYGITETYGASEISSEFVRNHILFLANLSPDTIYHYKIVSADLYNNTFSSDDYTFTTQMASDMKAPVIISPPTVIGLSNTSAVIQWETDEPSNGIVRYELQDIAQGITGGTVWENMQFIKETSIISDQHIIILTNLNPSTTYLFRVGSTDNYGNGPNLNQSLTNPSALDLFTTMEGPDEIAPQISNIRVTYLSDSAAILEWDTDEPCNSIVQYGPANSNWDSYPFVIIDAALALKHSIMITDLLADTLYYYRVGSIDIFGNGPGTNLQDYNPSIEMIFQSAVGPDVTAPQIINPRLTPLSDTTALIEWDTDEPGNSQVGYDTKSNPWLEYGFGENDAKLVTEHSVILTGLSPSTLYYVCVSSTDVAGNNYATSSSDNNPSTEYNFITPDADPPSIIVYPDPDYPKIDTGNATIDITYDEPNMQNATLEANYIFAPNLLFNDPGNSIKEISSGEEGSTYRLSFISVPQHQIFSLTLSEEITDADGFIVDPSTILINDNDADELPDDWEIEYGLDPTNAEIFEGQGKDGDFDGDGFTNYDEFLCSSDPIDSNSFCDIEPVASIISPTSDMTIEKGQSVNFQCGTTVGNLPLAYSWDFDGGATNSNQENPGEVIFQESGEYTVTLTITDADGDTSTDSVVITVKSKDDPPPCFISTVSE